MSYIDSTYYRDYFTARGIDVTTQLDAQINAAALVATEYLDDTYNFFGVPTDINQEFKWPRSGVYTSDNIAVNPTTIPDKLKQSTSELAYIHLTQDGGLQPLFDGKAIKKIHKKIDVLETTTEYDSSGSETYDRYYSAAINKIKSFISGAATNNVMLLERVL